MTISTDSAFTAPIARAEKFQQYFDGTQYDQLLDWRTERDAATGKYVPIRTRKPSVRTISRGRSVSV
jgi:hypothetical protein